MKTVSMKTKANFGAVLPATAICLLSGSLPAGDGPTANGQNAAPAPTLEETRLSMGKWIETQQIISKERNEWQQGKEVLASRVELVKKEISTLQEKIQAAQATVDQAAKKQAELQAENDSVRAQGTRLAEVVGRLEGELRSVMKSVPEPTRVKLAPLFDRIPEDASKTRATPAERYQNVLVILGELNKVNTEINISYEVRKLADGRSSEVKAIYVGLAQAYYLSANGEAGIGRPAPDGWTWEPSKAVAAELTTALEILQGKHTPAFVPLPVKIQ
jgi:hypothetical protein